MASPVDVGLIEQQRGAQAAAPANIPQRRPQQRHCGEPHMCSLSSFRLRIPLPDVVSMQTRQPNLEGNGAIPLRRLVKEALRMRPSRIIVGEVRQEEALDLLIALNSGLPGMCSIHADSARDAVIKLCTLPLLAGENIGCASFRARHRGRPPWKPRSITTASAGGARGPGGAVRNGFTSPVTRRRSVTPRLTFAPHQEGLT